MDFLGANGLRVGNGRNHRFSLQASVRQEDIRSLFEMLSSLFPLEWEERQYTNKNCKITEMLVVLLSVDWCLDKSMYT